MAKQAPLTHSRPLPQQFSVPPQLSEIVPQETPAASHVVGVQHGPQSTLCPQLFVCGPHLPAHVVVGDSGAQQTEPL
jgi:hypothetical protein